MSRSRFVSIFVFVALSLPGVAIAQSPGPSTDAVGSAPPPAASCPPGAAGSAVPGSPGASVPAVAAGSSGATTPAMSPGGTEACLGTRVAAQLLEMAIPIEATELPAGSVTFDITNVGTVEHEFVVVATDLPADQLPVKDGVVDETQVQVLARTGLVQPGANDTLDVELPAGHYVVICNLPGHYLAGMRTEITVQ